MKKALIIGANGQDGFYLNQLLVKKGYEVTGVSRGGDFLKTDITDFNSVQNLLENIQPELIFHLAANSTAAHHALFDNHAAISTSTLNFMEALKASGSGAKLFLSGSGLQFKNEGKPIKETDAFDASSAYAVARIHSAYAARYYRSLGLKVYVGYFFNHESPRRTERHISRSIAETVKRIASGSKETLEVGDLSVAKEWAFAGDIMKGVLALVDQDRVFEAVIGSGVAHTIRDYVAECFRQVDLDWKEFVKEKEGFRAQYRQLLSDPTTINNLGWKAETGLEALATMMLSSD